VLQKLLIVLVWFLSARNKEAKMKNTDLIQTWKYRSVHRSTEETGRVELRFTETLDFCKRTVKVHVRGIQEGERVDETSTRPLASSVTPEAAAEYRARAGYVRVG
jgi:hypothetical protein